MAEQWVKDRIRRPALAERGLGWLLSMPFIANVRLEEELSHGFWLVLMNAQRARAEPKESGLNNRDALLIKSVLMGKKFHLPCHRRSSSETV